MSQPTEVYARMLKQLLPRGAAWELEPDDVRSKVLQAIADPLARVDARADQLMEEIDPRTALELLPEWERAVRLPDEIVTEIPLTVPERRIAVLQKLIPRGGQSRQYFIDLADISGFIVTITEYAPLVALCGRMSCGDPLYSDDWAFVWQVDVDLSSPGLAGGLQPAVWAECGTMNCGDLLRSWNGPILEAVIRRAAPAHTIVYFTYA